MGSAEPLLSQVRFQQALPNTLSVVQRRLHLDAASQWCLEESFFFCIQLIPCFLPPPLVVSLAQPISHVVRDNSGSRALQRVPVGAAGWEHSGSLGSQHRQPEPGEEDARQPLPCTSALLPPVPTTAFVIWGAA